MRARPRPRSSAPRAGDGAPMAVVPPEAAPDVDLGTILGEDTTTDKPWLVIVWNAPINL